MMRLIKPGLLFILLLICTCSFAQKESNTWYFGINAGLNFNVNPPAILTNGQTSSREGVATISDKATGQLLFYTEGTTVWNRNHVVMSNGSGLLGDYSSAQSSIVVPNPTNNNRYYLFTTALMRGMHYSEVDMTLAGGNGNVVAATKNTPLIAGFESSEKLMAVKHCNGVDYWVITHKLFSSSFIVYLVNATGVQPGVTYNIGAVLADANNWTGVGYLKLSSTGGRLAHVIGPAGSGQLSNVELLQFDDKTGAISGPVVQLTGFNVPYGAEFSPQGRYLYISENLGRRVAQYDLAAPNINASRTVVQTSTNLNYGALQLGPDGKIYVAAENGYNNGYGFLSRIDNPEGAGAACIFVPDAVNLGTGRALIGLPTFAASYLLKDSSFINYTAPCINAAGTFSFTTTANIDSVKWNFGDGAPISTQLSPSHTYINANTYNVQLILYKSCNKNDTIAKPVKVVDCATAQSLCKSSLGFNRANNAIVDVVPTGTGALSQLYNATTGFTWEAWYRPAGNIINQSLIMSTEDAVLFQDIFLGFGWGSTPNALSFMISDNGFANNTVAAQSTQTFNPNTWYHVAAVCDYGNAQLRLYVNGVMVASNTIPAIILAHRLSGNRLTQIGNASARASGVNGSIDEVRFWSTPKSTAEILANMNQCLILPQTGLVAYFKADENGGLSSKSEVDANFTAILRGATWTDQLAGMNCTYVSMADSLAQSDCTTYFFKGLPQGIALAQIAQWQWYFGDGGTANTQNTSHAYPGLGMYTVKLVVTDVNGCKDSITRNIGIASMMADAGRDTAICTNTSVSINLLASGGTGYSWSPAAMVSNAAIANPVATVSNTTKFYVTVTNVISGCSAIDSVTITIKPVPTILTNRDTAICRTSSLPLMATGAASYTWIPANVVSNPAIANPNFIGSQTQELIVTGTTALGCKSTDTVQITVDTLPVVRTLRDTTICNTQSIVLTTTGAQTYQWDPPVFLSNPNIANPTYTGNTNQTYEVVGTDGNGCIGKDTIAIAVRSVTAMRAPRDTSVCRGEMVTLNGNNGPAYQYAWSPGTGLSNPAIEHPVFNGTSTTPYTLTISENDCNTRQSFNVLVTVNPLPLVTATRSNDIDCGTLFSNLLAAGAVQYIWTPVDGLNNPQVSNPRATPSNNTIYTVNGTDANGCSASANVEVKVLTNGKNFSELPNSFSPNGDGLNDCYGPGRFWQNIVSMQFIIYNRWGEQVFYSTNPANCWNGMYKGAKAEAGAYVYHLRVKTSCGDVEKKGSVILVR